MDFGGIGGNDLFWKIIFALAFVGCLSTVAGFIYLIVWLIKHLRIV